MNEFHRKMLLAVILIFFNLPVYATYLHEVDGVFFENPLKGVNKMAINIKFFSSDPYNSLEDRERITKSSLESEIAEKLKHAGFEIISMEAAKNDPEAVFLDLEYHINLLYQLVYTFDMSASVRQKFKKTDGDGSYITVKTWSDGRVGGMSQSGLGNIRTYTHELVENFIQAHKTQN